MEVIEVPTPSLISYLLVSGVTANDPGSRTLENQVITAQEQCSLCEEEKNLICMHVARFWMVTTLLDDHHSEPYLPSWYARNPT